MFTSSILELKCVELLIWEPAVCFPEALGKCYQAFCISVTCSGKDKNDFRLESGSAIIIMAWVKTCLKQADQIAVKKTFAFPLPVAVILLLCSAFDKMSLCISQLRPDKNSGYH